MGFRINTNIAAMTAQRSAGQNNVALDKSLQRLSSGLRINTAADDASGLTIANQLRAQSSGLGQAINNANDAIGVTQTADGALDEYQNIVNIIRTKAIQAASDGQSGDSRAAIQRDISKLLEEADHIAKTTSFNGIDLLNGSYNNKNFQIGAYANETVALSIDSTRTSVLGQFANQKSAAVTTDPSTTAIKINGTNLAASAAGTDKNLNALAQTAGSARQKAEVINDVLSVTGVTADALTTVKGVAGIGGGTLAAGDVFLNGVDLGQVKFSTNDSSGSLVAAFNRISAETGVTASIEDGGKLLLTSEGGSNIQIGKLAAAGTALSAGDLTGFGFTNIDVNSTGGVGIAYTELSLGTLTLESDNAITIKADGEVANIGFSAAGESISVANGLSTADVTTYEAAQQTIKKTDYALKQLDAIRSNIGSTQNQLESSIRNISVTQVNVSAAESQIRDVDFAAESATFAKRNILAQSGSYAMSQANAVQQNVMRLLQ